MVNGKSLFYIEIPNKTKFRRPIGKINHVTCPLFWIQTNFSTENLYIFIIY